ncbi:hypothetical protein UPYG_G00335450 [Umbra pygmaea]|uniref:Homeobox domain-containing protein n=1 Tax=Umbra pygmaea TaxID=75934 RepID=A0ABD0WD07_UMBPY
MTIRREEEEEEEGEKWNEGHIEGSEKEQEKEKTSLLQPEKKNGGRDEDGVEESVEEMEQDEGEVSERRLRPEKEVDEEGGVADDEPPAPDPQALVPNGVKRPHNVSPSPALQVKMTRVYGTRRSIRYSARGRGQVPPLPLLPAVTMGGPPPMPPLTKKKTRTLYSTDQLEQLEGMFQEEHYPDAEKRKEIATIVGVTPQRIMVWFQNRRAKWRKAGRSTVKPQQKQTCNSPKEPTPNPTPALASNPHPRLAPGHTTPFLPPPGLCLPHPPSSQVLPSYSTLLASLASSPAGRSAGVGDVGLKPVEHLPPIMYSPPPLRRATLPLLTTLLNSTNPAPSASPTPQTPQPAPTSTSPHFMDVLDSNPHTHPPNKGTQGLSLQTDPGCLFEYSSDTMSTSSVNVDPQHYLTTSSVNVDPQQYLTTSSVNVDPQQYLTTSSVNVDPQHYLTSSQQGGATVSFQLQPQASRLAYLTPSPYLNPQNPEGSSLPPSYLTFGPGGRPGVVTYGAGSYFPTQTGGGQILVQSGIHGGITTYQSYPWDQMYSQRSQLPTTTLGGRDPTTSYPSGIFYPYPHTHSQRTTHTSVQAQALPAASTLRFLHPRGAVAPQTRRPTPPLASLDPPTIVKSETESPPQIHSSHFHCDFSPIPF